MNEENYKSKFSDLDCKICADKEAGTRAGRALAYAIDIRKFEIELYWKRATYFWTLIAAAFAGYALTYKTASDHEPWLSLLFSALGLVISFAWYLVNRGSKFWQNNWERHVDLLEDLTIGPLYKIVATSPGNNPLTDAAHFSVTKINQMLSLFITTVSIVLLLKSVSPVGCDRELDLCKLAIIVLTVLAVTLICWLGRSNNELTKAKLHVRTLEIES